MGDNRLVTDEYLRTTIGPDNLDYSSTVPPYSSTRALSIAQILAGYSIPGTAGAVIGFLGNQDSNRCPSTNQLVLGVPIVHTHMRVSEITATSARIFGLITNMNNGTLLEYGICYSSSNQYPTKSDNYAAGTDLTEDGSAYIFEANITGLTTYQHYFARAYARNESGIVYGILDTGVAAYTGINRYYGPYQPGYYYNNGTEFMPQAFYAGQAYQGGFIANIYANTNYDMPSWGYNYDVNIAHGLIVAHESIEPTGGERFSWDTNISQTTYVSNGRYLSDRILATTSAASAAKVCDDSELNGYTDWFLPSLSEYGCIRSLYEASDCLLTAPNISAYCWTSLQTSSYMGMFYAAKFNVGNNSSVEARVTDLLAIRPVRNF